MGSHKLRRGGWRGGFGCRFGLWRSLHHGHRWLNPLIEHFDGHHHFYSALQQAALQCIQTTCMQQHYAHSYRGRTLVRGMNLHAAHGCAHMRSRLWYTPVKRTVSALSPLLLLLLRRP